MIQKLVNTQQTVHLYEVLDYLVTPACSRIDTGVYATTDITAEMTVNFTNTTSGAPRLFSTHDSSWDYPGTWGLSIENVNIPVVFPLGYQGNFPVNYAIQQNVDYRFRLEGSGLYTLYDNSDNVLSTQDFSSYTSSITSDTSIYLFFFRDSHEYITQDTKVYSCKIWDNDVLIKDYIPVKRLSDNKYGMYDNVSRTFHPNEISGYDFSGVSKSVPEYIDEQQSNATYVNDIKFNGSSINRIYLDGEVYWGNDPIIVPPTPPVPTKTNTVRGKGTPNTIYNDAIRINRKDWTVTTDAKGYFTIQIDEPVYDITGKTGDIFYNTSPYTISQLDLRDLVYDNVNGVDLALITNRRSSRAALTDLWFDFTDLTKINSFGFNCRTNITNTFKIHGLGTLNAVFPLASDSTTLPSWSLREGTSWNGWHGTLDIRGIDTRNVIDWPRVGSYPPDSMFGAFYNWPGSQCYCDTLIIGNLEWPYDRFSEWNVFTTLYCTSTTPPSLNRTGQYGITAKNYLAAMTALQNIYVPVGCLSVYQNAPVWSDYANKMSELNAPDPLTI